MTEYFFHEFLTLLRNINGSVALVNAYRQFLVSELLPQKILLFTCSVCVTEL